LQIPNCPELICLPKKIPTDDFRVDVASIT
jgi:hypothetical protein